MPRRPQQINELLKYELANLISRDCILENGLITIIFVDCSPDLRFAKIGISVLPENLAGSALAELRRHNSQFAKELKRKLSIKYIPKFNWVIDNAERHAIEIEKILSRLDD